MFKKIEVASPTIEPVLIELMWPIFDALAKVPWTLATQTYMHLSNTISK